MAEQLAAHYPERGIFEDRLGEFNQAIGANLSTQSFEENECTGQSKDYVDGTSRFQLGEHENAQGICMDLQRFQNQVLERCANSSGKSLVFGCKITPTHSSTTASFKKQSRE